VTIHPRPDQEAKIQEALEAGLIRSAEDVIDAGLERLREQPPSSAPLPQSLKEVFDVARGPADEIDFSQELSQNDWEKKFDIWVRSFPKSPILSDEAISRESMYPDRW
jgi:hypothetical protein